MLPNFLLVGAATLYRKEWFFSAAMVVIGSHYPITQNVFYFTHWVGIRLDTKHHSGQPIPG